MKLNTNPKEKDVKSLSDLEKKVDIGDVVRIWTTNWNKELNMVYEGVIDNSYSFIIPENKLAVVDWSQNINHKNCIVCFRCNKENLSFSPEGGINLDYYSLDKYLPNFEQPTEQYKIGKAMLVLAELMT